MFGRYFPTNLDWDTTGVLNSDLLTRCDSEIRRREEELRLVRDRESRLITASY